MVGDPETLLRPDVRGPLGFLKGGRTKKKVVSLQSNNRTSAYLGASSDLEKAADFDVLAGAEVFLMRSAPSFKRINYSVSL